MTKGSTRIWAQLIKDGKLIGVVEGETDDEKVANTIWNVLVDGIYYYDIVEKLKEFPE